MAPPRPATRAAASRSAAVDREPDHPRDLLLPRSGAAPPPPGPFFPRDPARPRPRRKPVLPRLIEAARTSGRRRLRVWSAGCSTGEEAYSLAIIALLALRDAGEGVLAQGRVRPMPGWTIEVVGTDISGRALNIATSGVYGTGGLSSFRDV